MSIQDKRLKTVHTNYFRQLRDEDYSNPRLFY